MASMPQINFVVTSDKQAFLDEHDANLYTVAFDGATAYWTNIYDHTGTTEAERLLSTTANFPEMSGGKLYVMESYLSFDDIQNIITAEDKISPKDALTINQQFRYDSFEYTYNASGTGNLTSVTGFGFPLGLKVEYDDSSSATSGYKIKGDTLATLLDNSKPSGTVLFNFSSTPPNTEKLDGELLYVGSPSVKSQGDYTNPYGSSDWTTYLTEVSNDLASNPIGLAGWFNGAASVGESGKLYFHNQAFYNYVVSFDASESQFVLTPTGNSQVKGIMKVDASVIAENIYAIDPNTTADIYNTDGTTLYKSEFLGANDQWGYIFTQFLTGFDLGYFGQEGIPNEGVTGSIDLNQNWNWLPTYAFGENLVNGGTADLHYDDYSKVLFDNSNSYGSQYSDNAMSNFSVGGPLLNLYNIASDGSTSAVDPSDITLTIFDDAEDPSANYTPPQLYSYLAPTGGKYVAFDSQNLPTTNTSANMKLSLGLLASQDGNTSWFVNPERFALSYQYITAAGATYTWSDPILLNSDSSNLWSSWQLDLEKGTATVSGTANSIGAGSLILSGIPLSTTAGEVSWQRLNVYDKAQENWQTTPTKTFNVYTTSDGNGNFVFADGKFAIDGGATNTPPSADNAPASTTTIKLLDGSQTFIDPDLMGTLISEGTYALRGTPAAPVVGTYAAGVFTALSGQDSMTTPSANSKTSKLSFAWTAADENASTNTVSWMAAYTNKTSASHTAKIEWVLASSKDHGTNGSVSTTADIDGKWVTEPTYITPGKYHVTMTEYDSLNQQFAATSSFLTLTANGSIDTVLAMRDSYLVNGPGQLSVTAGDGTLYNDKGTPTKATLVSTTSNGSLTFNEDGSFVYDPDDSFVGLDTFVYKAEAGDESSIATVNLQVVPDIGLLAGSLDEYAIIGLSTFGYLEHGSTLAESDAMQATYAELVDQGLDADRIMYTLANELGETSAARVLFPFLANPTADDQAINGFLDKVYDVLFDRTPDDVGRAYWLNDIKAAIGRGEDIDPYVYIIMNGAQNPDMQTLAAKSLIAAEQIFQQYQHNDTITDVESATFLTATDTSTTNILDNMVVVYNDAV